MTTRYQERMAAMRLLTDICDQENGKEERCWRSSTDNLFFVYWLEAESSSALLRPEERSEVERHINECHWCKEESEIRTNGGQARSCRTAEDGMFPSSK